jgi:hypothetical protein
MSSRLDEFREHRDKMNSGILEIDHLVRKCTRTFTQDLRSASDRAPGRCGNEKGGRRAALSRRVYPLIIVGVLRGQGFDRNLRKFVRRKGLRYEIESAELCGLNGCLNRAVTGDHDDRQLRPLSLDRF